MNAPRPPTRPLPSAPAAPAPGIPGPEPASAASAPAPAAQRRPRVSWRDLLAGIAIAGMLLPEAVAYSAVAGVPPVHALVAALVGLSLYPLIGTSRFATVSATSSSAAIFASTVAAGGLDHGYALVGLTGGLFLLLALLRADFLASFVSRPVLTGFTWALAVTIVIKQLPDLSGVRVTAPHALELLWHWLQQLARAHVPTVLTGASALALWLLLRRGQERRPWLQPSLIVLVLGMALSLALGLGARGVALVGPIDLQGVRLQWPQLAWNEWVRMAQLAPAMLMIVFAESWGSVRSLALQNGDTVNARREMAALGAANFASSLLQGLPVGAGFSASSANYAAGGRSKLAGVAAAAAIALLLLGARGWLALLPVPVLAAIVVGILSDKLSPRSLLTSLRLGGDAWLAVLAAAGVLFVGVLPGMLITVGLSLLLALRRFASPRMSELGRLPGSHDFIDLARHPEMQRVPGVRIERPEEPVFFANAENLFRRVAQEAIAAEPPVRVVVLSLEVSDALDTTALDALDELRQRLQGAGIRLLLARVKDVPRAQLARAGIVLHDEKTASQAAAPGPHDARQAGVFTVYWSVDDAVNAAQAWIAAHPPTRGDGPTAAPASVGATAGGATETAAASTSAAGASATGHPVGDAGSADAADSVGSRRGRST